MSAWSSTGLLIVKLPNLEDETLVVPQIHMKKAQSSGFFYIKGRESGRGYFCKTSSRKKNSPKN